MGVYSFELGESALQHSVPTKMADKQINTSFDSVDNLVQVFQSFTITSPQVVTRSPLVSTQSPLVTVSTDKIRTPLLDTVTDNLHSDMSPVYGDNAVVLKKMWASGLDYNPYQNKLLSQWCRDIYFGEISNVKETMAIEQDNLLHLLHRKESKLMFCALFHVICGALSKPNTAHVDIAKLLLEHGANPNTQDFAGFAPLHHCFTMYGNGHTLEIAKLLLEHGADVHAQNRIGCTALFEPCLNKNYKFIEMLVTAGCRPDVTDNTGFSCLSFAWKLNATGDIKMHAIFSKGYRKQAINAKKSGLEGQCMCCDEFSTMLKRCSGCLGVVYCSKKCQKSHWVDHKELCKMVDTDTVTVNTYTESRSNVSYWNCVTGRYESTCPASENNLTKSTTKKNVLIKIQIPLDNEGPDRTSPMYVYNRDRTYKVFIMPTDANYLVVYNKIADKGFGGVKAYFCGLVTTPGQLQLNMTKLFNETW